MAYAVITSFKTTLSHLRGDDKELMEVLQGKLDSLRTLVEETYKIVRDHQALKTLEAQTEEIAYTVLIIWRSQNWDKLLILQKSKSLKEEGFSMITSQFDVRGKITVSQEYHVRNLYLGLFHYTSSNSGRLEEKNDEALVDLLQKSWKGRRYLVIVDGIWTTAAWDEISMCFPLHNNGSRILLTTGNTEVAEYPIQMCLLTFDECWNLLYQKVFKNECLSTKFEKIGKEIARICQGLPLAAHVVMARVVLKIGNSVDEWKKVVEDVNVLMSKDLDRYCSKVLALSYYHLSCHLRAFLLYLVFFKKSNDRLWAAEGFVDIGNTI